MTHPPDGAEAFAAGLVEARLAACVNLLPVTSVYRWEGAVERAGETLLVLKTATERLPAVQAYVADRHPYDTPELVALAPEAVEERYLAWLLAESRGKDEST